MEDIKFHQCVRLARFENDRTISFIPPDGEFDLMSYRLNTHVKPLIWVEAVVEPHSHSRIEYMIKAKSQFKQRSIANPSARKSVALRQLKLPRFLGQKERGGREIMEKFQMNRGFAPKRILTTLFV